MARYTDSVCRLCRREGCKLFLKGERCNTDKCALARRSGPPGNQTKRKQKLSEYGMQLREKQKAKRYYGLLEKQFKSYFKKAEKMHGITGSNLLQLIERRLDNVVYRLGYAASRPQARQLVLHGHIRVNGKKVNIASFKTSVGDVISVAEKSITIPMFKELRENGSNTNVPKWLDVDMAKLEGSLVALPDRDDVDIEIAEHLIVELYSK